MAEITNPNPEFRGNIVLLHDSGGDRSRTIEVLGPLIDTLRANGYKLVPVSELAGLSRDQAMPPLSPTIALMTDRVVFLSLSWLGQAFYYLLPDRDRARHRAAVRSRRARVLESQRKVASITPPAPDPQALPVSVLIPAYNEEVVIATTVERILASDYPGLEVIVIDDGSRDRTVGSSAQPLRRRSARDHPHDPEQRQGRRAQHRTRAREGRDHRRARRRHAVQSRHDFAAGALVRRPHRSAPSRATPRSATAST